MQRILACACAMGLLLSTSAPLAAQDASTIVADPGFQLEFAGAELALAQDTQPGVTGQPVNDQPPADVAVDEPRDDWFGVVEDNFYEGGRGLITLQGMAGMFLNPTSGTLGQGQFTAQWCVLLNDEVVLSDGTKTGVDVWGNGVMVAYGVTDWLEVGVFTLAVVADPSPFKTGSSAGDKETLTLAGPFARVRILKDEEWWPEVSVGGIWLDGDSSSDLLARQEVFVALSKRFDIDPEGFIKGVRVHGGGRYIWRHERPDGLLIPANGVTIYGGVEVELPYAIYLVGEVNTKDDVIGPRTPYAFGVQWRPNQVVGISLAGMQPGDSAHSISLWVGVGLNFEF